MVSDARCQTRNQLGTALDAKASDHFTLSVLRTRQTRGGRGAALLDQVLMWETGVATTASLVELAHDNGTARAVKDQLDRGVGNAPSSQFCWLTRSLRTRVPTRRIAEVASDPDVVGVGVPHRIRPAGASSQDDVGGARDLSGWHRGHELWLHDTPVSTVGRGPIVAVIDSEVAAGHPALAGRVVPRHNYTTEPWGEAHKHGTALAGIIASDDAAHPGVVPDAIVYGYKVIARDRRRDADDFDAALALQRALEDGATVAMCAWGAGPVGAEVSLSARAVDRAWALGMVVVTSAGNRGPRLATMSSPADASGVIVVGATNLAGTQVQPYSSRGPAGRRVGPDCVAPGGAWTTDASDRPTLALVTGGFGHLDVGTSYAAALVAGAAGLLLREDPRLGPSEVRQRLVSAAVPLADGSGPEAQGAGFVPFRP